MNPLSNTLTRASGRHTREKAPDTPSGMPMSTSRQRFGGRPRTRACPPFSRHLRRLRSRWAPLLLLRWQRRRLMLPPPLPGCRRQPRPPLRLPAAAAANSGRRRHCWRPLPPAPLLHLRSPPAALLAALLAAGEEAAAGARGRQVQQQPPRGAAPAWPKTRKRDRPPPAGGAGGAPGGVCQRAPQRSRQRPAPRSLCCRAEGMQGCFLGLGGGCGSSRGFRARVGPGRGRRPPEVCRHTAVCD